MKHALLASAASALVIATVSAAHASDIGLAGPAYDWSGGNVGVNLGAALNNSSFSTNYVNNSLAVTPPATQDVIDSMGIHSSPSETVFTAGISAGYDWQYDSVVLGVEGDFNYTGFNGSVSRDITGIMNKVLDPVTTRANDTIEYDGNWFGTVRGRLGYAIDNVLLYGTGGLAYGKLDLSQKAKAGDGTQSLAWSSNTSSWNLGWTAGAGIEYGLDKWVLGLEYLYVDLGTYEWNSPSRGRLTDASEAAVWSGVKDEGSADYSFNVVRATAKYRF